MLLLLVNLLRKLLDFPALLSVVSLGVMHRAPLATVVTDGRLAWALVAT
jgi:hypothetical protein